MLSRSLLIAPIAFLVSFVVVRSAPAQDASFAPEERPESTLAVAFEGFVLEPSGAAAPGAVVVSSAGGRTVTGFDGRYRLEVQVPPDAESVCITAVAGDGSARRSARASSGLLQIWGVQRVDPLVLALQSDCEPQWLRTFGGSPEVFGTILALAVFDDGSGPALYAGGSFTNAGGLEVDCIAKWDGSSWTPLGSGMAGNLGHVSALAVFDDGSGAALYAGGSFATAGGVAANNIAKWDGSSWAPLGSGVAGSIESVYALTVFDDGTGPALYAGGSFSNAGDVVASNIAKWDGSSWAPLGSGVTGGLESVYALTAFDGGGGAALYVGGSFTFAGGAAANRIAKWSGAGWSPLAGGMDGTVRALAVYDDGSGAKLHASGDFITAGGATARCVARWNGSSWAALGSGMGSGIVSELLVYDDGSGTALHAGGSFTTAGGLAANHVAKWNGSSWAALGSGTTLVVQALASFDDGKGAALYAGHRKWNGSSWSALNDGLDAPVLALTVYDDGSGPALHAGGSFTRAGLLQVNRVGRWDGSSWAALRSGIFHDMFDQESVLAFATLGTDLYVGGHFDHPGGNLARWNGSRWTAVGAPVSHTVRALTVFDDGTGAALYAGGEFSSPGAWIAKWDGSSWSSLGNGMNFTVNALAVFDDGSGPALYAGGGFTTAGGVAANHIAKWDGSSWSPLGSGMNGPVNALAVLDFGGGSVLVAGSSGGPQYIAKWDGSSWSPLNGGMNAPVLALTVFDDGSGAALYAGGDFTTAGGVAANRIAKWRGAGWSPLDSGLSGSVHALAVFDDGAGLDLYVGGDFTSAFDSRDGYLARWGCPFPPVVRSKVRMR